MNRFDSPEVVEAMAKAAWTKLVVTPRWDRAGEHDRIEYREAVQAVIAAMLERLPATTEHGVALELHAVHIAPLLELVRNTKGRADKKRDASRNMWREVEHRLERASWVLRDLITESPPQASVPE